MLDSFLDELYTKADFPVSIKIRVEKEEDIDAAFAEAKKYKDCLLYTSHGEGEVIHARRIFIKILLDSRMHGKLTYRIFTVYFDKPGP